ncbi:ABC transporter substrate-binding protein [Nocardia goodfellowii]
MKPKRIVVVVVAMALLAAGCGGRGGTDREAGPNAPVTGDFGTLRSLCQDGQASSAPTQGVTADAIEVGVFTDAGFTKKQEFVDAAKVFTSWCNAAGGINGRDLVYNIRDAKLMEVRQRMLDACREDFALVGGGAALDGLGVKDRLSCLLPDFPGQVSQLQAWGSDLQVGGISTNVGYEPYYQYFSWLMKEAHPASAQAVGLINGDTPITKVLGEKANEALVAAGGNVVYNDLYPAQGVPDWTPYAQSLKSKGVRGLIFFGDFRSLAKLEDALTSMDYKLDWIDANNNAYGPDFLQLAQRSLAAQHNYVDLGTFVSLEDAATVPAVEQVRKLFAQYAPGTPVTFPVLKAFAGWVLFAKAASSCGDQLTRRCVYEAALKEVEWTAGGLHAPANLGRKDEAWKCFHVLQATTDGWKSADFKPNNGPFRCGDPSYRYQRDYGKPLTLADVGKSMSDVK